MKKKRKKRNKQNEREENRWNRWNRGKRMKQKKICEIEENRLSVRSKERNENRKGNETYILDKNTKWMICHIKVRLYSVFDSSF